jgi:hypothetical protein
MPSKSKKQLKLFQIVKAYVDGGSVGLVDKWKETYPGRGFPSKSEIDKIVRISEKIDYADLEDMASGVEGDSDLGDTRQVKVGYWMKFEGWYMSRDNIKRKGAFIAKITRVRPDIKLVNFNSEEIYNYKGVRIAPLKRTKITNADSMWLDFAYFDQIMETAKDKNELVMKNEELRKLVKNTLKEHFLNENTGGLTIKHRDTGEDVSVRTNMLVQKISDESKGQIKNVGVDYDTVPPTNNLNVKWHHGDLAGTTQTVDLDDVVAI